MSEDKLTRDERIRLEALAQAQVLHGHGREARSAMDPLDRIVLDAKELEHYIRTGD